MRRHDYKARTDIEFGAEKGLAFTEAESKELREDMTHEHPNGRLAKAETQANVEVRVETNRHSLEGIAEKWGLNFPNFRFSDGSRAFISQSEDADGIRLLFNEAYGDGGGHARGYKYPVESFEAEIHWHETPDCPVCGAGMTYGMVEWDPAQRDDGFMSGWLCNECLPSGVSADGGIW